jgi:hypothetical protein
MVSRHLKILNDIIIYLLYDNIYISLNVRKQNIDYKIIPFFFFEYHATLH